MSFRTWFADLQIARTFDRLQRDWRHSPRRRRASSFCLAAEVLEVRSLTRIWRNSQAESALEMASELALVGLRSPDRP
jgi:hypothetical protein